MRVLRGVTESAGKAGIASAIAMLMGPWRAIRSKVNCRLYLWSADSFGNFHWLRACSTVHEACASHFELRVDHATVRVNLEGNDHGSFYSCKSGKWGISRRKEFFRLKRLAVAEQNFRYR